MKSEKVLAAANFDLDTPRYIWTFGFIALTCCVATIPLLPFWILFGYWYSAESVKRTSCRLTDTALIICRGIFFRSETNIPLDKITDVAILQGPLMRLFGIYQLRVETAGQNHPRQGSEGILLGVLNSRRFRSRNASPKAPCR